ncbi:MAG: UDP-2,4-diacetamido-2,4,6-trideoxy-beta-L-altropyranose hydrolase [Bacteroidetes bacterium]|nr:UDP-2,4-diacetamido-2,4,6-trideoxy-beta-L-altropyranose hydrolase [Bacteroidota bacterium]MBP6402845.1 UDP-2,4-diacetamido-2,4,6-trideoxy-beta-L-altropyranose hydrolase [Bacteroidia bacterium]MBP6648705.1 UDP-2,4-diacetamido-2,4,6-trideoxy-beta-L-altropyranose hydrolase [Bacteroidia bacterium]
MKPRIILRADGGAVQGMGHVVRCLALAEILRGTYAVSFAIQEPEESTLLEIRMVVKEILILPKVTDYKIDALNFLPHINKGDIVVLDGYHFTTDYEKSIRSVHCKLVLIDDLHSWHHVADFIFNSADSVKESDFSAEPYTRYFLGLRYVLLRKPFIANTPVAKRKSEISSVFLNMGASDSGNLTMKFTNALSNMKGIREIHLMLGAVNVHTPLIQKLAGEVTNVNIQIHCDIPAEKIVSILLQCDLAICPASTISMECCAVGIPMISGYTIENQKGVLEGLTQHKVLVNLGDLRLIDMEMFQTKLKDLINNLGLLEEMVVNQRNLIDGNSPKRILDVFHQLAGSLLTFRFAEGSDVDLYFKWTNDPVVRENSFHQEPVSYPDHVFWFEKKLKSKDCFMYVFLKENIPAGQVRIELSGGETVIGISIDQNFRGQGLGAEMIQTACADYLKKHPGEFITAYIKENNKSSYAVFKKAGFGNETHVIEKGISCYKLIIQNFRP